AVVARHQPARIDPWAVAEAGGVAARAEAAQHLGERRACRVLEVRGVQAVCRSTARLVSVQRVELVPRAARDDRTRMEGRRRAARPDARRAARCGRAIAAPRPSSDACWKKG